MQLQILERMAVSAVTIQVLSDEDQMTLTRFFASLCL